MAKKGKKTSQNILEGVSEKDRIPLNAAEISANAAITASKNTAKAAKFAIIGPIMAALITLIASVYINNSIKPDNDIKNIEAYNEQREGLVIQSFDQQEDELRLAKIKLEQKEKDLPGRAEDLQVLDNSIAVVKNNKTIIKEKYKKLYNELHGGNTLPAEITKTELNQTIINTQFNIINLTKTLKNVEVKPLIHIASHFRFVEQDNASLSKLKSDKRKSFITDNRLKNSAFSKRKFPRLPSATEELQAILKSDTTNP